MTCVANKYRGQDLSTQQISFDLIRSLNLIGRMAQTGTIVTTTGGGTAFETIWGPESVSGTNHIRCGLWNNVAAGREEVVFAQAAAEAFPRSTIITAYSAEDGSLVKNVTIPAGLTIGGTTARVANGGIDSNGSVYLYDQSKHAVIKLDSDFAFLTQIALPSGYRQPNGGVSVFAVDATAFYVTLHHIATNRTRLLKFDLTGTLITSLDIAVTIAATLFGAYAQGNQCFLSDGRLVILGSADKIAVYNNALVSDSPTIITVTIDGGNLGKSIAVTSNDELVIGSPNSVVVYNTIGGVLVEPVLDVDVVGALFSAHIINVTSADDLILVYVLTPATQLLLRRFNKNTADTETFTHTWTIDGVPSFFVPLRKYASQHCAEPPSRIVPWTWDDTYGPVPQVGALTVPYPEDQIAFPAYQAPTSVLIVRDLRSYIDQIAAAEVLINKNTGAVLTRDWSTVNDLYYAAIGHSAALKTQVGGSKSYSWQRTLGYLVGHPMDSRDLVEMKLCADYLRDCALAMVV